MVSFLDNPNALVGIGVLVFLLLIASAALVAVLKLKQKREFNNQGKIYISYCDFILQKNCKAVKQG